MNKKFITLVVLSLLVAAPAFAGGSTTYHGKVTVTSSGNGTVYLSDSVYWKEHQTGPLQTIIKQP